MGRSVSTPSGALVVAYNSFDIGGSEDCETCEGTGIGPEMDHDDDCPDCNGEGTIERDAEFDWECIVDDFQTHVQNLFPSTSKCDEWLDREDHALMENGHARFGISEYCGLVAYWVVPKDWDGYGADTTPLAERWINSIAPKFTKAFGQYEKLGTASNGESFYRKTA